MPSDIWKEIGSDFVEIGLFDESYCNETVYVFQIIDQYVNIRDSVAKTAIFSFFPWDTRATVSKSF